MKYKQNLKVAGIQIFSYNTLVAVLDHINKNVILVPWNIGGRTSSPTTSKHINHVAREHGYEVIEQEVA